jgi:hypothetical protein
MPLLAESNAPPLSADTSIKPPTRLPNKNTPDVGCSASADPLCYASDSDDRKVCEKSQPLLERECYL